MKYIKPLVFVRIDIKRKTMKQTTWNKEHAQTQNITEVQGSTSQNYHKSINLMGNPVDKYPLELKCKTW